MRFWLGSRRRVVFIPSICLLMTAGHAWAGTPILAKPDPAIANIPVTQFQANTAPVMPTPPAGHAAVGAMFAIQSYSSSQQTPVSPKPGVQACLNTGKCSNAVGCIATAKWPSVSQSIAWWQNNNQALRGTYAWYVGSAYSHQDAMGWQLTCQQQTPPSCQSKGSGWTGSYTWNASADTWVSGCSHHPQPGCPIGWSGSYSWNGSTWVDQCHQSNGGYYGVIVATLPVGGRGHDGAYVVYGDIIVNITKPQYACLAGTMIPGHTAQSGRRIIRIPPSSAYAQTSLTTGQAQQINNLGTGPNQAPYLFGGAKQIYATPGMPALQSIGVTDAQLFYSSLASCGVGQGGYAFP